MNKPKHTAEHIIEELGIEEKIVAIYPYGSQVYGNATKYSDHDYILVAMSSMLNSGAFKNNAISNPDKTIQGTLYSRGGFQNAINNYEMPTMECISLPDDMVVMQKLNFKVGKWDDREMIKKVIQLASASRHVANKQAKTASKEYRGDLKYRAAKGMFQAIRILNFGLQLKEHKKIVDFSACNDLYNKMVPALGTFDIDEFEFDTRDYFDMFDEVKAKLEE